MRPYACYLLVLAAVISTSCQKTADSTEKPATEAASASGSEVEVPAGTDLWVRIEKTLDSAKLKQGDKFKGEIADAVMMSGKEVIPKGSTVSGRVTNSVTAQSQGSAGLLSVELDSVKLGMSSYAIQTAPATLQATALKVNPDSLDKREKAAVEGAVVPKNEMLQFSLLHAVRIKR